MECLIPSSPVVMCSMFCVAPRAVWSIEDSLGIQSHRKWSKTHNMGQQISESFITHLALQTQGTGKHTQTNEDIHSGRHCTHIDCK